MSWNWLFVGIGCVLLAGLFFFVDKDLSKELPSFAFVSGTEYNVGERGQIIVEARFLNGTSAISNNCTMSIWYPDKALYLSAISILSNSGNQYIEFIVPNVTGVYEYQATCPLITGDDVTSSKSFHVSEFQNDTSYKLNRIRAVTTK